MKSIFPTEIEMSKEALFSSEVSKAQFVLRNNPIAVKLFSI